MYVCMINAYTTWQSNYLSNVQNSMLYMYIQYKLYSAFHVHVQSKNDEHLSEYDLIVQSPTIKETAMKQI